MLFHHHFASVLDEDALSGTQYAAALQVVAVSVGEGCYGWTFNAREDEAEVVVGSFAVEVESIDERSGFARERSRDAQRYFRFFHQAERYFTIG